MKWQTDYLKLTEKMARKGVFGPIAIWFLGTVIGFGQPQAQGTTNYYQVRLSETGLRVCGKATALRMLGLHRQRIDIAVETNYYGRELIIRFRENGKRKVRRVPILLEALAKQRAKTNGEVEQKVSRKSGKGDRQNKAEVKAERKGKARKEKVGSASARIGRDQKGRSKHSRRIRDDW